MAADPALAADLSELTDQQWATRSLCDRFTVREVLAHLTAGASLNPARWLAGVIRCRFDFDQMVAMRLAEKMGAIPADTLGRYRHVITSTTKPALSTAMNSTAKESPSCATVDPRKDAGIRGLPLLGSALLLGALALKLRDA